MRLLLMVMVVGVAFTGCPRSQVQRTMRAPPVAVILPGDVNVTVGEPVTLDGATSYDPQDKPLSWSWRLRSLPAASHVAVERGDQPSLTITPDVAGSYAVELVVSAEEVESSPAIAAVIALDVTTPVIANAGADQTVTRGSVVQLDGSASQPTSAGALSFAWRFTAKPASSAATLMSATGSRPSFVADVDGVYDVELEVKKGAQKSIDTARVTATSVTANRAPVANAGADRQVTVGTSVTLNGSGSSDPDADPLTYAWTIQQQPAGTPVTLSLSNSAMPNFVASKTGAYLIQLTVSDPKGLSSSDSVQVNVSAATPSDAGPGVDAGPSADAGPSGDAGSISDIYDPAEVYLAGTLAEGSCNADALAHWSRPNEAAAGFDCYFDNSSAQLRPTDGRMLYTNTFEDRLREFHCDQCPWKAGTGSSTSPLVNDTVVTTLCPDGSTTISRFRVSPQGTVLHACQSSSAKWRDPTGTEVYDGAHGAIVALGHNGLALVMTKVLDLNAHTNVAVTGLPSRSWLTTRSLPDGFWVVVAAASTNGVPELWKVDSTGAATKVGDYPALPAGFQARYSNRLDGQGALFQIGDDLSVTFRDVILRRVVGGASDVVYSEGTSPLVKIHISDLVTGP